MTELCSGLFIYMVLCLFYLVRPPPKDVTIGTIIRFWLLYPGLCAILVVSNMIIKGDEENNE